MGVVGQGEHDILVAHQEVAGNGEDPGLQIGHQARLFDHEHEPCTVLVAVQAPDGFPPFLLAFVGAVVCAEGKILPHAAVRQRQAGVSAVVRMQPVEDHRFVRQVSFDETQRGVATVAPGVGRVVPRHHAVHGAPAQSVSGRVDEQAVVVESVNLFRSGDRVVVDPVVQGVGRGTVHKVVAVHQPGIPARENPRVRRLVGAVAVAKHVLVGVDVLPVELIEVRPGALNGAVQEKLRLPDGVSDLATQERRHDEVEMLVHETDLVLREVVRHPDARQNLARVRRLTHQQHNGDQANQALHLPVLPSQFVRYFNNSTLTVRSNSPVRTLSK